MLHPWVDDPYDADSGVDVGAFDGCSVVGIDVDSASAGDGADDGDASDSVLSLWLWCLL